MNAEALLIKYQAQVISVESHTGYDGTGDEKIILAKHCKNSEAPGIQEWFQLCWYMIMNKLADIVRSKHASCVCICIFCTNIRHIPFIAGTKIIHHTVYINGS